MSAGSTTPSPSGPMAGKLTGIARLDAMSTVLARNWWLVALRGAFAILFGILALVAPGATLLTLVLFFSAYMVVDGVFTIVCAVRAAEKNQRWGLLLIQGLVGIALLINPGVSALVLTWWLGGYAIAFGAMLLVLAFSLRGRHAAAGRPLPTGRSARA